MNEREHEAALNKGVAVDRSGMIGGLCALGAFGLWGFLPVYFKYMEAVPPLEILAHRIVWSVVFVGIGLFFAKRWVEVWAILRNRRLVLWLFVSAVLLSCNWLLYIWAVTNEHMLQGSLGYYINPLVNIVLGVLLLGERLSKPQWAAVTLSTIGVTVLAFGLGEFPWIAVSLALLFGFYGYVRKANPVGAAAGLFVETLVVIVPAFCFLMYLAISGEGAFTNKSLEYNLLLVFAGIVTAVPLILFAAAATRLRYATVGFFQYLAPTLQFLLAVFVYGEAFTEAHQITFALIWCALAIYSFDVWRTRKHRR